MGKMACQSVQGPIFTRKRMLLRPDAFLCG